MNLIDTRGNAYKDVIGVSITKTPNTYGYDLQILLAGRESPVYLGHATPGMDILPSVKEVIAQGIAHNAECIDLRDHFNADTRYYGWYGCDFLKKDTPMPSNTQQENA